MFEKLKKEQCESKFWQKWQHNNLRNHLPSGKQVYLSRSKV